MAVTSIQPSPRRFALADSTMPMPTFGRLVAYARVASSAVAIVVASLAVGLLLYGAAHDGRVYQGVSVAGVDVGGMTETEARDALDAGFASYMNGRLGLEHNGQLYAITPAEAGMALDTDATVARAMDIGRSGSLWGRSQRWAGSLLRGVDVPAVVTVDDARADASLSALTAEVAVAPVDARLDMTADEPTLVQEVAGVGFDLGLTKGVLAQRVAERSSDPLPIYTVAVQPSVTTAALEPALATTRGAVDSALVLRGVDGQAWTISEGQLRTVVRVSPDGAVSVDADAVRGLVKDLAKRSNHDAVDARLYVDDAGVLRVVASQASVAVEVQNSTDEIVAALMRGDDVVPLSIDRRQPAITDQLAEQSRLSIEALIAPGVTVVWDGGELRLGRDDLADALAIEPRPGEATPFAAGFAPNVLADLLAPVAAEIDKPGNEPVLRYVDGEIKIHKEGRSGEVVDIDGSVERVMKAVEGGHSTTELEIVDQTPTIDADEIDKIELPDVLAESSTYYGTSSEPRRQNVERAVELETGWMVAPGEMFSYVENIGAVDEENEFVTGLGIVADGAGGVTTAPVVGGGICQVSTTIFQSAFWAGLQIVERTPHPYWIQSYGEPPTGMKGLDAMVNVETDPNADAITLDMVFRNTTENWIAVVMTADGENITSKILGRATGWSIEVDGPEVDNVKAPDPNPIYQDSPELAPGEERQVETAQEGFDATVVRRVLDRDGVLLETYAVTSTYGPAYNRILRGAGSA